MSTIKVDVPTEPEGKPKVITFRRVLLTKCQQEFEKDKKDDEERENMLNAIKETEDVSAGSVCSKIYNSLEGREGGIESGVSESLAVLIKRMQSVHVLT